MTPENPTDGRRFALLTEATMTPRQRESYQGIVSGPRKGARGPFNALLRSPEVADRVQKVGEYIRFQSTIPAALNEMAILITGRFWGAQYEFWAHSRLARTAGLPDAIIDAIAEGRRPSAMSDDERVVHPESLPRLARAPPRWMGRDSSSQSALSRRTGPRLRCRGRGAFLQ